MSAQSPAKPAPTPTSVQRPAAAAAPDRRRSSRGFNSTSRKEIVVRYALLVFVLFICIGPFLWQLSTSLKGAGEDIYTTAPSFIPQQPTLGNYAAVSDAIPVLGYIGNSLVVAALSITGNVLGATFAGFAMARLKFRFRKTVIGLFLATLVLPGEATIVSQFVTIRDMGLADTLLGVALPGMIGTLNVLLMYNAFRALPEEIDHAAIMDGANVWQRLRYIGLPSVKGTLAVIIIFTFIGAWDDFLWPLIVLTNPENFTLTIGLQYLASTFGTDQRLIAAGTMIAFIPVAVVFAAVQRWFFKGVGEGAVKG